MAIITAIVTAHNVTVTAPGAAKYFTIKSTGSTAQQGPTTLATGPALLTVVMVQVQLKNVTPVTAQW